LKFSVHEFVTDNELTDDVTGREHYANLDSRTDKMCFVRYQYMFVFVCFYEAERIL